jgi:transcription factor C subunit 6
VYNIAEALNTTGSSIDVITNILPTHYITVHQSAIRALAWIRVPPSSAGVSCSELDPTVIASAGYDGLECLTDVREGSGCVMNRTRGEQVCYLNFNHAK